MSVSFAPAKINLTLHVTGQREDGYHLLDSLVVFADIGDIITFTPGPEMRLEVIGPFAAGVPADARNLVWQAAELVGWTGHIVLEKHLPHGGGLGGGSADAAAVLNYFDAPQFAFQLGADVAVCLSSQSQRMQGIGERLTPLKGLPVLGALLVNPNISVSTPQVFKALAKKKNPEMAEKFPAFKSARVLIDWLAEQRNDLENPATEIAPEIGEVLHELSDLPGAHLARMSGSGSTCYALFTDAAALDRADHALGRAHPDWWVFGSALNKFY